MDKKAQTEQEKTTFDTWGRVALQQVDRLGELASEVGKLQQAAVEQGRDYLAYHMKLAGEWRSWAMDSGRKMSEGLFGAK